MAQPLILFDGVCNLCNGAVNFVIDHDPAARFKLATLQSGAGRRALRSVGMRDDALETIVLIEGGRAWTRSGAVLRIAKGLGLPWSLWYALAVIPRPVRDWSYDLIARNRYKWFGNRTECRVPTAEVKGRFVE